MAELYIEKGWEVHGLIRQRTNLKFLSEIADKLELHLQDIRDPHGVWATIKDGQFDVIHHLAAVSLVPYSWDNPYDTFQTNTMAAINIIQAVRSESPQTILHGAGSSEEYGVVTPSETPIREETIPKPASPYGVSKYAMDLLLQQAHRSWGLKTVITRAFNHDSKRRGDQFVTTQVVKQALEIKHGKRKAFSLGNLDAVRDFTDARDMVRAYFLAANRAEVPAEYPGVEFGKPYNVCSGVGHTILGVVLAALGSCQLTGMSGSLLKMEQDPKRMRPSDIPVMVGDPSKFKAATGWEPHHSFEDMLQAMVEGFEEELYG